MEEAEIVDKVDNYWVVLAGRRRYFLEDRQFACKDHPHVGQTGLLGYVQQPTSKVLMFTDQGAAD
ncbi:MAG TPA: hypothetical protein VL974_05605 [Magnetospirillum sp.]|jgi:hypothetical protein|nr:hypothetical protein [Magnetospirillum sp.]